MLLCSIFCFCFLVSSFSEARLTLGLEYSDFASLAELLGELVFATPSVPAGTHRSSGFLLYWCVILFIFSRGFIFSNYKNNSLLCAHGSTFNSPSCKCVLCFVTSFQREQKWEGVVGRMTMQWSKPINTTQPSDPIQHQQ